MWDLIVSVPDHCLYFYFTQKFVFKETFKEKYKTNFMRYDQNNDIYVNRFDRSGVL